VLADTHERQRPPPRRRRGSIPRFSNQQHRGLEKVARSSRNSGRHCRGFFVGRDLHRTACWSKADDFVWTTMADEIVVRLAQYLALRYSVSPGAAQP
jgi:hypothetical protein